MSTSKDTLKLYWQQVRKHKPSFFLMLVCIPFGALLIDTILPYFLSQAIGALSDRQFDQVQPYLWFAVIVGTVGAIVNFIGFQAAAQHESRTIANLRKDTFNRLIKKDHAFFVNHKIGSLTSHFIDFVRAEVVIQDLFVIRTLGFILSVGSGLIILAFHSLLVAGIMAALIVLLIIQIRWSTKFRQPWRQERKRLASEIHGAVADSLTNTMVVKTFAGEQREMHTLDKLTARFSQVYRRDIGFTVGEGSTRVALMIAVQVIAIIVAVNMVSAGQLTIAAAIFMLAYLQRIGSQLFVLGDILNNYDQAFLDASPMTEMLTEPSMVDDVPGAKPLSAVDPTVELRDVSYRYTDGNEDVVDRVNLVIPAGQKVGLVGHSGAGKSTITHLLLRFADVTEGSVYVGGLDIRDVTQQSLRQAIAYVPQEPLLFHRSLRDNIAYGKPDVSDDEIWDAAEKANAREFIEKMPNKLDTLVGERGVKLSGGQRQRIAIARAIIKDAPILVLDEATSALDSESEKLIQQALRKLMKGRTSIVIAHRLSTIARLDRIIVLDGGKIVEDGTHQELLDQGGIYATLWAHQSGGFIEE